MIVVSALGRDDFIMRAVENDARFYLIKSIDLNVLTGCISEVCGQAPDATAPANRVSMPGRAPSINEN